MHVAPGGLEGGGEGPANPHGRARAPTPSGARRAAAVEGRGDRLDGRHAALRPWARKEKVFEGAADGPQRPHEFGEGDLVRDAAAGEGHLGVATETHSSSNTSCSSTCSPK